MDSGTVSLFCKNLSSFPTLTHILESLLGSLILFKSVRRSWNQKVGGNLSYIIQAASVTCKSILLPWPSFIQCLQGIPLVLPGPGTITWVWEWQMNPLESKHFESRDSIMFILYPQSLAWNLAHICLIKINTYIT